MNSDQIINILAVRYSMTNHDDDLEALLDMLKPIIKAKARQSSHNVPTTQCHQLKDATTLKAPKGRHKTGPLFQQIHAQIGARILGDSAN